MCEFGVRIKGLGADGRNGSPSNSPASSFMPARVTCPSCQKKLQVSSKFFGNKINCPGCKVNFVAQPDMGGEGLMPSNSGPLSLDAGRADSKSKPAAPSPYESLVSSLLTQPNAGASSQPVSYPLAASPAPATSPYGHAASYATAAPKKQEHDAEDGLPWFVHWGIYMMIIGLLALVLPLFGLQLRRLNGLGGAAPIVGMLIALGGCAFIFFGYLSRGKIDLALMFGGVPAVMFVMLTVAGGFFLASTAQNMTVADNSNSPSSSSELRGPSRRLGNAPVNITADEIRSRNQAPGPSSFTNPARTIPKSSIPSSIPTRSVPTPTSSAFAAESNDREPTETGFENSRPRGRSASSSVASRQSSANSPFDDVMPETTPAGPPRFDSSPAEIDRDSQPRNSFAINSSFHEIKRRQMEMKSAAISAFGLTAGTGFPREYISNGVGDGDEVFPDIFVHPRRLPMLGLDYSTDSDSGLIETIIPVFDASENHRMIAEEGYAISGLNVHFESQLLGFQPIFMKIKGNSFDPNDSYEGEWFGVEPSEDAKVTLGNDGRPVYGLWLNAFTSVDGIALIIEKKK